MTEPVDRLASWWLDTGPPWWAAVLLFAIDLGLVIYLTMKGYRPMTRFRKDALERVLRTLVAALLVLGPVVSALNVELDKAGGKLTAAGAMAVATAVLAVLAKPVGDKDSASVLPPPPPPPPAAG